MKLLMVKDGSSIDITDRVTSIDISNATDNGNRLLGNAICSMLELELNNFDGSLKGCASCTFLYGPEETAAKEFNVQEAPSKYTGRLKLTLYDDMIKLNKAYASTLTYSTTSNPTIAQQIEEISTLSGISIDSNTLMASVTSMNAGWIDTTIIMRNYIGWIAELSGKNCYINDSNILTFENLAAVDHTADVASNFDMSEDTITISKVAYDDGVTLLQKGDETGKTLYIDPNNSYCTQQSIIDAIYEIYNGLSFHSLDNMKTIGLSDMRVGHTVTYDSLKCIVLSIKQSFQGTNSLFTLAGEVDIKNTDSVVTKENTEIRIKRVQTKVDQEAQRLDIVVTDVKNQDSVIDTLTLQVGEISTEVNSKTEKSESIKSVSVYYLQNTGSTPSKEDEAWSTNMPTPIEGQTMWSMQVYTMADGTTVNKADPVNITSQKGEKGDTGNGISSIISKYQASNDGTNSPTGTWIDTPPLLTDDAPFMWTRVTVSYTDKSSSSYYSVTKKGSEGTTGNGISSSVIKYSQTDSNTVVPENSAFTFDNPPEWINGKYIWACQIITYTDGTIVYIGKNCLESTAADAIKVGGRNLIPSTRTTDITRIFPSNGPDTVTEGIEFTTINVPNGTEYTLAFNAKSTINGDKILCYFYNPNTVTKVVTSQGFIGRGSDGNCQITLSTSYERYWIKWTQTGATAVKHVIVGRCVYGNGSGIVAINSIKLESGNKPTDWSPAPEDIEKAKTIKSIKPEYYLSSSAISLTDGSWNATVPEKTETTFIWTRNVITYLDNSTITSDAILENSLNDIYTITQTNKSAISQLSDSVTTRVESITRVTTDLTNKQTNTDNALGELATNTNNEISNLKTAQEDNANSLSDYKKEVTTTYATKTEVTNTANSITSTISQTVTDAANNAVTKKLAETVIDAQGFTVTTADAKTHTTINGDGMLVKDGGGNNKLKVAASGVEIDTLKATGEILMGAHSTKVFPDYEFDETTMADETSKINGTGDFWVDDVN